MSDTTAGRIRRERSGHIASAWRTRARGFVVLVAPPAVTIALAIVIWQVSIQAAAVPPYLIPTPESVLARLVTDPLFYLRQTSITLLEAMLGLVLGGGSALLLAIVLAHSRVLERSLLPLAIAIKVTPIIAVAPLLTIWFGFGLAPKILIAALIAFFPLLINAIVGFRAVNLASLDLLRSLDASSRQIFFTLRLPASLPYLFSALKVAITLSLIGALVGEWNGASAGLGQVILLAHNNLDMPTLFAAIVVLILLGVALAQSASLLERRMLRWHDAYRDDLT